MRSNVTLGLLALSFTAFPAEGARAAEKPAPPPPATTTGPAAQGSDGKEAPAPRGPGGRGRGLPGGFRPVFGEVTAVRGNVLQMRGRESDGLTRVILADNAQIIRDEKLDLNALKPGMKVMGSGHPVEGTGSSTTPMKVDVQTLTIQGGGSPFGFGGGFGPGDRGGPLLRGQRAAVLRKQNYSGTITFNAVVKSTDPLVLVDDQGQPLTVMMGEDVEVHQRGPHPIKEGDITAGARLLALGETTPDGLLNARTVILLGEGSERRSLSGTVVGVETDHVTVRPRFAPEDLHIEIDPAAKVYSQETLDLDSIHVGDTLAFAGNVTRGTASAPTRLVVHTIAPADSEIPKIDEGGRGFGPFGGGPTVTATVKGKITALEPLRVQTEDGHEIEVKVPGQVPYVRYRPAARGDLKAGQKALFAGRPKEGGVIADLIILNASLAMGPE